MEMRRGVRGREEYGGVGEVTGMRKGIDTKGEGKTAARLTGMGEPVEKTLKARGGIRQLRGHYVSVHRI